MLVVEVNRENLEYDVNSLVRAFYPGFDTGDKCCKESRTDR